jgi:Spy/CpxP family protein refolding chaperone
VDAFAKDFLKLTESAMRTGWMVALIALVACGLTVPALAQREPGAAQPERPGAQPGRGFESPLDMAGRLAQTLNLAGDQRTKYDAIVEKFRPKWEAQAGEREKMQELMRQIREARQSGDEARVEELRKQVQDLRESGRPLLNQFFAEVEAILTPEQVGKLNEFREQMERGRGGPGGGLEQLIQRLTEELKLTGEQRAKFDGLAAKQRAQQQELRPLMQELRKARQEGNSARVAELEKQIKEKGGDGGVDAFLAKIEPILTEEQKAKLPELWVRYAEPGRPDDAVAMLRAARRLELSEQQQAKLREITREAMRASRADMTPEKRAELAKSTKNQIVALLDAKQAADFEQALQRRGPRPEGGERRGP